MMPLLEAFLALALTMLSFAVIATLLVEMCLRVFQTRASDLRVMLEAYYDAELGPLVEDELLIFGKNREEHKESFLDNLVSNPLLPGETSFIKRIIKPRYFVKPLVELSTEDFIRKLATTADFCTGVMRGGR